AAKPETEKPSTPTVDTLGLSLAKITPELKSDLDLADDAKGVVVVDVEDDSAASKRGMRPGDIISAVGRDAVTEPSQVVDKVEAAKKAGRKTILLRIDRQGSP